MNAAHLVSLQMLLYASLWGLASVLLPRERWAIYHWATYGVVSGLALALVAWRGQGPDVLTRPVSSLLLVLGLLVARRGTEIFLHADTSDRQSLALTTVLGLALCAVGTAPANDHHRVALSALACAWIMGSALWPLARSMAREFGPRVAWATGLPLAALTLVHTSTAVQAWRQGTASVSIDHASPAVQIVTWGTTLVAAAAFNVMFLALVVMRLVRRLHHEATHDPLTGLLNRRAMNQALATEWQRHRRLGTPFAAVSLDIDHFKRINDTQGHEAGDRVLVEVAQRLRQTVREIDHVARMGGEEFLVLMPGCEALNDGVATAERLRAAVAAAPQAVAVTLSAGVAGPLSGDAGVDTLLQRCDHALYDAKAQGRNRTVLQPPLPQTPAELAA